MFTIFFEIYCLWWFIIRLFSAHTIDLDHGGGWGYSGQSVEAIRFSCDTDIILGGFGLFGGRGEYSAKIKVTTSAFISKINSHWK